MQMQQDRFQCTSYYVQCAACKVKAFNFLFPFTLERISKRIIYSICHSAFCFFYIWLLAKRRNWVFLATQEALHFTPVSRPLGHWVSIHKAYLWGLRACLVARFPISQTIVGIIWYCAFYAPWYLVSAQFSWAVISFSIFHRNFQLHCICNLYLGVFVLSFLKYNSTNVHFYVIFVTSHIL